MKFLYLFIMLFYSINLSSADTINIIGIPEEPYRYYNQDNVLTGFDIEIIDEIMNELNIDYHVELMSSSTFLIRNFTNKNIDMIFTLSKNPEREKILIYAEESHINISWNFFILNKNKNKLIFNNLNDLKGLKVGATSGFSYTKEFWEAAKNNVFTLDMVVDNRLNLKKLIYERFDTFIGNTIVTKYSAKKNGYSDQITYLQKPLKQKKYFNTFLKSSDYENLDEFIENYNHAFNEIKFNGRYEFIYNKYFE